MFPYTECGSGQMRHLTFKFDQVHNGPVADVYNEDGHVVGRLKLKSMDRGPFGATFEADLMVVDDLNVTIDMAAKVGPYEAGGFFTKEEILRDGELVHNMKFDAPKMFAERNDDEADDDVFALNVEDIAAAHAEANRSLDEAGFDQPKVSAERNDASADANPPTAAHGELHEDIRRSLKYHALRTTFDANELERLLREYDERATDPDLCLPGQHPADGCARCATNSEPSGLAEPVAWRFRYKGGTPWQYSPYAVVNDPPYDYYAAIDPLYSADDYNSLLRANEQLHAHGTRMYAELERLRAATPAHASEDTLREVKTLVHQARATARAANNAVSHPYVAGLVLDLANIDAAITQLIENASGNADATIETPDANHPTAAHDGLRKMREGGFAEAHMGAGYVEALLREYDALVKESEFKHRDLLRAEVRVWSGGVCVGVARTYQVQISPEGAYVFDAETTDSDAHSRHVERIVNALRRGPKHLWRSDLVGDQISVERMTDIVRAAFSANTGFIIHDGITPEQLASRLVECGDAQRVFDALKAKL